MRIHIRKSISTDIDFYQNCFKNTEFKRNIFGTSGVNILKFISEELNNYKYIMSIINNNNNEDIAFAHFYFNTESKHFDFVGGINPKYFNSGIGVYACVTSLNHFFSINTFSIIETHVFKYNNRSLKMLLAIGFEIIAETTDKVVLKLTYHKVRNDFVDYVLRKINITT